MRGRYEKLWSLGPAGNNSHMIYKALTGHREEVTKSVMGFPVLNSLGPFDNIVCLLTD